MLIQTKLEINSLVFYSQVTVLLIIKYLLQKAVRKKAIKNASLVDEKKSLTFMLKLVRKFCNLRYKIMDGSSKKKIITSSIHEKSIDLSLLQMHVMKGHGLVQCYFPRTAQRRNQVQSNLNSSNTDGSFTMANSNSVSSPYEILPIDQENKYLSKLSYFIMKLYVVCTH